MIHKDIVTLGNAASGKTNFMGCAFLYVSRKMKDILKINGNNEIFDNFITQVGRNLPEGRWMEKTTKPNVFNFEMRHPVPCWFDTYRDITVHDWPGEAFEALGDLDGWTSARNLDPGLKGQFLDILAKAQNFIIFIDVACLYDEATKNRVSRSLNGLKAILMNNKHSRRFAFALTKSDMLDWNKEYSFPGGDLNRSRIISALKDEYDTFFRYLEYVGYEYSIWPVSCIPIAAHRTVDPDRGTVPNKGWSVDDLQHNEQMSPFIWIQDKIIYDWFPWID